MSSPLVQPYLFFDNQCKEAIEFYKQALGAEVEAVMTFGDSPEPPPAEMQVDGWEDRVMHAAIRVAGQTLMMSDGCGDSPKFAGFSLALTYQDVDEVTRRFEALVDGGKVTMPLGETFWSPRYGMLTDRFGLSWMVMAECANGSDVG